MRVDFGSGWDVIREPRSPAEHQRIKWFISNISTSIHMTDIPALVQQSQKQLTIAISINLPIHDINGQMLQPQLFELLITLNMPSFLASSIWNSYIFPPGGHSNTWRWWGTSVLLTPVFDIFRSHWVPFLCPTQSYWPPISAQKIGLSLSHLVPEIFDLKLVYFSQKSAIWHFWSNLYQFSPWFLILLTPFFIVIRSFWPLIFTKL